MHDRAPESVEPFEQADQRGMVGISQELEDALAADEREQGLI
jgi:hypothetical protein